MKYTIRLFIILCLLSFPYSSVLADQPDSKLPLGFLAIRSQSPLQQVRFGMQHHLPWVNSRNVYKLYIEHNWKNVWMYRKNLYRIDAEIHELSARACIGVGRGVEISLELPMRYVSGGILDGMIERFHSSVGLGNRGRDEYPRNQFEFEINPDSSEHGWEQAGDEQLGWHLGNLVLAGSVMLYADIEKHEGVVATVNIKLPTGTRNEFFGGQSVDAGISIAMYKGTGNFYWYLSPGIVYYADREMIGVVLRQWHFSGLTALEYHSWGSRHSWIAQLIVESGIAKEFSQFTEQTYEFLFAYKHQMSSSLTFEIGFLENMFFYDNSPDIGLHLGVVKAFSRK